MASNDMREFDAEPATERRAAERAPLRVPCVVILRGQPHPASCVDVSEVGLGCRMDLPLGSGDILLGSTVKVRLSLDSGVLELAAVIVRAAFHSSGDVVLGLQFRNVSRLAGDQIRAVVVAHLCALRASGRIS